VSSEAERPSEADDREPTVLRTEPVLARPSVELLARLAPKPDPLQPSPRRSAAFAPARTRASASTLLPAGGFRAARPRARLRRQARRIHGERRDWATLRNGEERRRTRPERR